MKALELIELLAKYREEKYLEVRKAQDKYREASTKYHEAVAKYHEDREEAKARELTLARIDALRHWEDWFLTIVIDDEHRFFIAEVLAREAKALQEEDEDV